MEQTRVEREKVGATIDRYHFMPRGTPAASLTETLIKTHTTGGGRTAARVVAVSTVAVAVGCFIGGHVSQATATLDGSYWDELILPWLLWILAAIALAVSAIAFVISLRSPKADSPGFEITPTKPGRVGACSGHRRMMSVDALPSLLMSQQTLDYRSPLAKQQLPANRRVYAAAAVAAVITLIANAVLVSWAASDRSFGALGVMIMIGPITNGVLVLLSLPFIPLVKHVAGGASIVPYVLTGTLLPVGAVIIDAACILSMDLHGC